MTRPRSLPPLSDTVCKHQHNRTNRTSNEIKQNTHSLTQIIYESLYHTNVCRYYQLSTQQTYTKLLFKQVFNQLTILQHSTCNFLHFQVKLFSWKSRKILLIYNMCLPFVLISIFITLFKRNTVTIISINIKLLSLFTEVTTKNKTHLIYFHYQFMISWFMSRFHELLKYALTERTQRFKEIIYMHTHLQEIQNQCCNNILFYITEYRYRVSDNIGLNNIHKYMFISYMCVCVCVHLCVLTINICITVI